MKTLKVIDLLNKIANGEEVPKHIHIRDIDSYTWQEDVKKYWSDRDENNLLYDLDLSSTDLNEDIEILEEEKKIPEKLELIENGDFVEMPDSKDFMNKINEIIDYLKSKGE